MYRNGLKKLLIKSRLFAIANLVIRWTNRQCLNAEKDFFRALVPKDGVVFDVGANRGQSSQIFLLAGFHVVAFEPNKSLHSEMLQRCLWAKKLSLHDTACSPTVGKAILYQKSYDELSSFDPLWQGDTLAKIEVATSTLDIQMQKHGRPHYCKIDVEGHESSVLAGLSEPIDLISFEFHTDSDGIARLQTCLKLIHSLGPYCFNLRFERAALQFSEFLSSEKLVDCVSNAETNSRFSYGEIFARLKRHE